MIKGLRPYERHQDSGISWFGEIPLDWSVVSLARVASGFQTGPFGSALHADEYVSDGVPVINPVHLRNGLIRPSVNSRVSKATASRLVGYQLREDDIIFARRGELGRCAIVKNDQNGWVCGTGSIIVRLLKGICYPSFLAKFLGAPEIRYYFSLRSVGSTMESLNEGILKGLPVLIPPLKDQCQIVRFLNFVDRRISRYIIAKRKLIALFEEQKQAIINRAVTRGLDSKVPLKDSGVPWFGMIPSTWELQRAKSCCTDIVDCKNRTPEYVEGGAFIVVRTTCIKAGEFDDSGGYSTDQSSWAEWTKRGAPRSGDVFFTREAPAGEACLVPDRNDLCMGQRMMYFRPDPTVLDGRFLLYVIYGPYVRRYIEFCSSGSTVSHLRLGQVYALPMLLPSIAEQSKIADYLDSVASHTRKRIDLARKEIALLGEYRTRLISDVVTGKLDVRDAAAKFPIEDDVVPDTELVDDDNSEDSGDVAEEPL